MARINDNYDNYAALLGGENIDAASGALFAAANRLDVNQKLRTVLIGIGGTGIDTIDYVKGVLTERLQDGWNNYVAFLAIDSDYEAMNVKKYIGDGEKTVTTKRGVKDRMKDRDQQPLAVLRAMYPVLNDPAIDWEGNGSGQRRLVGRVKLHDKAAGGQGVDEEIVSKLRQSVAGFPNAAPGDNVTYQVYVIGSICGGTCCGAIQDMPALVKKALPQYKVNCMLYLPDTMTQNLPENNARAAEANAYAALKEINYYQAMTLRQSEEKFYWNYYADSEISLSEYFSRPMLIGTVEGGATGRPDELAEQTVCEYLINSLVKNQPAPGAGLNQSMTIESALNNTNPNVRLFSEAVVPEVEKRGEAHDMPYSFASIGVARAAAPFKVVKAYAVGKICQEMGIKAVEDVAGAFGNGVQFFTSRRFTATQGTMEAKQLLQPFNDLLNKVFSSDFDFQKVCNGGEKVEWDVIHSGENDTTFKNRADSYVENNANTAVYEETIYKAINTMVVEFRENVAGFIKQYGPQAFVSVYEGSFIKEGENEGIGIRKMLENLRVCKNLDGTSYLYDSVTETEEAFTSKDNAIKGRKDGVLNRILDKRERVTQANSWVRLYNSWINAKVNERRRGVTLGQDQYFDTHVVRAIEEFVKKVQMFGHLLDALSDIYANHQTKLDDFDRFSRSQDSQCEINLAAIDPSIFQWVKGRVDNSLAGINMRSLRDRIIDDFMRDPEGWLDDAGAVKNGNALVNPSKPIAARTKFDEIVSETLKAAANNVTISINDIFTQLQNSGRMTTNDVAISIMSQLRAKSQVLFNGNTQLGTPGSVLVIPSTLAQAQPAITAAIIAQTDAKTHVFESADADGVMLYNCVAELPLYRLNNLGAWERQYLARVNNYYSALHGLSPAAVEETINGVTVYTDRNTMAWKDFPAITVSEQDPTIRRQDGTMSREGELRLEVRKTLKDAEKYGIVYTERTAGGTTEYYRVWLDHGTEWKFDPTLCVRDAEGYLPRGKQLMEAVMAQNNRQIYECSKKIQLFGAGNLMDGSRPEFIERIVRADVGTYMQIKETLARFQGQDGWARIVDDVNQEVARQKRAERFAELILGGNFKQSGGVWNVTLPSGVEKPIFNPTFIEFLTGKERQLATEFLGFYLYKELIKKVGDDYEDCIDAAITRKTDFMEAQDIAQLSVNKANGAFIKTEAEKINSSHPGILANPGSTLSQADSAYLDQFLENDAMKKEFRLFYAKAFQTL